MAWKTAVATFLCICCVHALPVRGQSTAPLRVTTITGASAPMCVVEAPAGRFTYEPFEGEGGALGDGCDERAAWLFDFRETLNGTFADALSDLGPLTSATLSLALGEGAIHMADPSSCNMGGDIVWITGEARLITFNDDEYFTHTIELLDTYAADLVRNRLQNGLLSMRYENDAKVLPSTTLTLTFDGACPCDAPVATWTRAGSGRFADVANWEDNKVPGPDSTAFFDSGGTYTVTLDESVSNNNLVVQNDVQATLNLAGNTYTLTGTSSCDATDAASLTVSGGSSTLILENGTVAAQRAVGLSGTVEPEIRVGANATLRIDATGRLTAGSTDGFGVVSVRDGGHLDNAGPSVFGPVAGEAGTLEVTDASADLADLVVGDAGEGTLRVAEGAEVTVATLTVAAQAGESAVTVTDNGFLDVSSLRLGLAEAATGRLTLSGSEDGGAGSLFLGLTAAVGGAGTGTVELTDGAFLEGDPGSRITLGLAASGLGTLSLSGADTGLSGLARLVLGQQGQGTATFEDEASADVTALILAEQAGSTGTLAVGDPGTTLDATTLVVGRAGTGTFTLADSALATLERLAVGGDLGGAGTGIVAVTGGAGLSAEQIALGDDGTGQLTVGGPGASEVSADVIFVGDVGTGLLRLEEGATLTGRNRSSSELTAGSQEGGTGTLTLTGPGTRLAQFRTLTIGGAGSAVLMLEEEALVEDVQALVVAAQGEGEVIVRGSGTRLEADDVEVGQEAFAGPATLHVSEEGRLEARSLVMARGESAQTETLIAGATVALTGAIIGQQGQATVIVTEGGTLQGGSGTLTLGLDDGGTGTIEVSGLGTTLEGFRHTFVGGAGSGLLRATADGTLVLRKLSVPLLGGEGEIFVDGAGAYLQASRVDIGIGGGVGTLRVTDGASARLQHLNVGPLGTVDDPDGAVQVGQPGAPKHLGAAADTTGIVTDTLFVAAGAVLAVDSVAFHPGGVLGGTAPWNGDLTNHGTIAPGDSSGAVGTFAVEGAYTQTDAGILAADLAGVEPGNGHDVLAVNGAAHLAGTLRLSVQEGFVPEPGQTFEIVTAETVTGQFDAVEEPEKVRFDVLVEPTRVVVTVLSVVAVERDAAADNATEEAEEEAVPAGYALGANYPNPFNPQTVIPYALPQAVRVRLAVYDVYGREVAVLVEGMQAAGRYEAPFDVPHLSSGTYVYRLEAGPYRATGRMLLLK